MEVRILGKPREADAAKRLPNFDQVAGLYLQAAAGHMAILGFPMLRMFDHDAVATFDVANCFPRRFAEGAIRRALTRA